MSVFAGILQIEDTTAYISNVRNAADIIGDAMPDLLAQFQAERNGLQALWVDSQTVEHTERVMGGGFDEGQEIGPDGRPLETHVEGYYDVAYPLKRIGWALGYNEETFATLTVADLDRQFQSKTAGNARRHMREIFRALLLKSNYTFPDPLKGNLTIRRLANTDGTKFAPVAGSDDFAEDNHYLASGYVSGSMSGTNNPLVTLAAEIREHFTSTTRIVAFINSAQRSDFLTKLPNFEDRTVEGIQPAPADAQAIDPGLTVPGDFLGVDGDSGVYVYVYDRVPSTYIAAGAIDEARPLKRRIPAVPSLQGFNLAADEAHFPFYKRTWIERFGYGVANRLSWAVMELTADATYDDPTF